MMDFIAQLRRWAEAELRRRMRMRDGDADSLRRLIEYPWTGEAITPLDRGTIAGRLGVAKRGDYVDPRWGLYMLEHGMLIVPASATAPLSVYATTELSAYLSGSGTAIPSIGEYQWLIGGVTGVGGTCIGGFERYDWTTSPGLYAPPYLSLVYAESAEISSLLEDQNRTTPGLWTGLARLLAQICGGSAKTLSALLQPIGWTPDPETDGLVRLWDSTAQTHRYWYVRITSANGVQAVELTANVEGKCALAWLASHELGTITLSDDDRRWFESWVLRSLYIAGESPSASEIIADTGIADVYADDAAPVAHGWHFSRLRMGTAQEALAAASITTLFETTDGTYNYHTTTTHTVTFSISGGALSGLLTSGDTKQIHIEHTLNPLWYWDATLGALVPYYSANSTPAALDASGPVYCLYDDTSGLIELIYIGPINNATYAGVGIDSSINLCCADSWSDFGYNSATNVLTGGWEIGSVNVNSPVYSDGRYEDSRSAIVTAGQTLNGAVNYSSYTTSLCAEDYQELVDFLTTYGIGGTSRTTSDSTAAILERQRTVLSTTAESGGWCAIISNDNAEAVYLFEGIAFSGSSQSDGYAYVDRYDDLVTYLQSTGTLYVYWCCTHDLEFIVDYTEDDPPQPIYDSTGPLSVSHVIPTNISVTGNPSPISERTNAFLITSGQTYSLNPSLSAITNYLAVDLADPERSWNPQAVLSYHDGSGWYYETPSGFTVTDALPESPSTHLYIPIGAS